MPLRKKSTSFTCKLDDFSMLIQGAEIENTKSRVCVIHIYVVFLSIE